MQKEYKTIREISGPLVFVEKTEPVSFGELVQISLPDGTTKRGQVLDTSHDIVVVQIFEGTSGISGCGASRFSVFVSVLTGGGACSLVIINCSGT